MHLGEGEENTSAGKLTAGKNHGKEIFQKRNHESRKRLKTGTFVEKKA